MGMNQVTAIDRAALERVGDRRLFLVAAILFVSIIFAGFARSYYLKAWFGTPPLASLLVEVHALVMTAWVALVATQVWLIRSRNVAVHMKVGIAGAGLAVLVAVTGFFAAVGAAKNGSASFPRSMPRLVFLAIPLFDLVLFVVLVGTAILLRRRPADHKRLMLLALISLLDPALGRMPIHSLQALGPLFVFGFPTLLMLLVLAYDRWRLGKFNRVFAVGAMLLIVSYPLRMMLMGTEMWLRFAQWLTTFALV